MVKRTIMKKRTWIGLVMVVAILMTGVSVWAQDQNGATLYVHKFCTTCHGKDGIAIAPNYPNLAKQNELYMINQVKDIIAKKRANNLTLLMTEHPVVVGISDAEISAIAAHMTKIK